MSENTFEWTPFSYGFVFWESPKPEFGPPSPADDAGLREWLEGFMQAYADDPDPFDPEAEESLAAALDRLLAKHPALPALKTMLRPG